MRPSGCHQPSRKWQGAEEIPTWAINGINHPAVGLLIHGYGNPEMALSKIGGYSKWQQEIIM